MRPRAFLDSNVVIAAVLARDSNHKAGLALLRNIDDGKAGIVETTDYVLCEILNFLQRKAGGTAARAVLRRIETNPWIRVRRLPESVFEDGKGPLYHKHTGLSLVDALTVAFMRENGIRRIYTFDADFDDVQGIVRMTDPGPERRTIH